MLKIRLTPTLQEEPVSPDDVQPALQAHERQIGSLREALGRRDDAIDQVNLARELTRWAQAARLALGFDEAETALEEALAIYDLLGRERPQFLTRVRVAVVRRCRGELAEALGRLDALVAASADEPYDIYRGVVLEERGRCRFEAGDRTGALADVEEALRLLGLGGGGKRRVNLEYAIQVIRGGT
jgi:tetratricopeptide (TPR) repeat protein